MKNKWIFLTLIGVAVLLPAMGGLGFAGTTDGTAARPGDERLRLSAAGPNGGQPWDDLKGGGAWFYLSIASTRAKRR